MFEISNAMYVVQYIYVLGDELKKSLAFVLTLFIMFIIIVYVCIYLINKYVLTKVKQQAAHE